LGRVVIGALIFAYLVKGGLVYVLYCGMRTEAKHTDRVEKVNLL
jgi:hypothetical protein